MKFYISPDQREKVEHKLNLMFKHLEEKPQVTFGNVEQIVKQTIYNMGVDGYSKHRTKIQAIEVEIEDIRTNDWILVATVDYNSQRLLICDARYFKDIPEQYGLKYTKCDHCGSEHKHRVESHILYNEDSGEWMQVGSTCINKMLNGGKYLNGLMIKLFEVFNIFGGCGEDGWHGGWWRPSNSYLYEGIPIYEAMSCCLNYMNEHGDTWQKVEWDGNIRVPGTNDHLIEKMSEGGYPEMNAQTFEDIKNYFDSQERGEDDEYDGPTLTQKIIDAFNNDFIALKEMYIAWFAIIMYNNTFKAVDFESTIKKFGIEKGMEYNFYGDIEAINTIETIDPYTGEEGVSYEAIFRDDNIGLKFNKTISYPSVIDRFKQDNGKYKFTGTIKYIAFKRQYVGFGGRLKKTK